MVQSFRVITFPEKSIIIFYPFSTIQFQQSTLSSPHFRVKHNIAFFDFASDFIWIRIWSAAEKNLIIYAIASALRSLEKYRAISYKSKLRFRLAPVVTRCLMRLEIYTLLEMGNHLSVWGVKSARCNLRTFVNVEKQERVNKRWGPLIGGVF